MTNAERLRPRRRSGSAPIRHGRLRSRNPIVTLARILAGALAVLLVSGGSVAAIAAWDITSSIKPGIHLAHLPGHSDAPPPDIGAIDGGVNLLLAGTDTRTGQGGSFATKAELAGSSGVGNNDVTMMLHIAQDHHSVTVVSFPRDAMVAVPACPQSGGGTYPASSKVMLNTTLSRGGLSCVVLTIEKLTGVQIPFAAEISFDGVIALSDAVGGVTVCLATPIHDPYTNLDLDAGQQTIVGAQALAFLRTRHGVADGSDLGRISNQQVFMSALARKITSGGVLGNPLMLYPLAKAAASNMVLSDTLTNPTTMVQIALALKDTGLANMVFLQYPTMADPDNPNRVVPLTSAAAILDAALVADRPIQLSGTTGRAAVLDPSAAVAPVTTPSQTAAPGGTAPVTPTATPTPVSATVVLPTSVTGQTAAQQTCTKGNSR